MLDNDGDNVYDGSAYGYHYPLEYKGEEMSFSEQTKKKDFNWEIDEVLAEIQKNKYDIIKIQRATLEGVEYGQLQIWHTNADGVSMPKKDCNITFRLELKEDILEGIRKL